MFTYWDIFVYWITWDILLNQIFSISLGNLCFLNFFMMLKWLRKKYAHLEHWLGCGGWRQGLKWVGHILPFLLLFSCIRQGTAVGGEVATSRSQSTSVPGEGRQLPSISSQHERENSVVAGKLEDNAKRRSPDSYYNSSFTNDWLLWIVNTYFLPCLFFIRH